MRKLSKSSINLTPEEIEADTARLHKLQAGQGPHFTPGTGVIHAGSRGEILERTGGLLTVQWDDGSVSTIRPIALNQGKESR